MRAGIITVAIVVAFVFCTTIIVTITGVDGGQGSSSHSARKGEA